MKIRSEIGGGVDWEDKFFSNPSAISFYNDKDVLGSGEAGTREEIITQKEDAFSFG